jgi:hypothetical protein
MTQTMNVRWGWLKGMYVYTIVVAGGFGLGIVLAPGTVRNLFGMPEQDPMIFGFAGSVSLAFAFLSVLGLRSPLKFSPILLLQLSYKAVWFAGIILPLFLAGRFPSHALLFVVIFATFVVGDLIAIPFSYLFAPRTGSVPDAEPSAHG